MKPKFYAFTVKVVSHVATQPRHEARIIRLFFTYEVVDTYGAKLLRCENLVIECLLRKVLNCANFFVHLFNVLCHFYSEPKPEKWRDDPAKESVHHVESVKNVVEIANSELARLNGFELH